MPSLGAPASRVPFCNPNGRFCVKRAFWVLRPWHRRHKARSSDHFAGEYAGPAANNKTGESYHDLRELAGYCGFAVAGYRTTGKSRHEPEELAGYDGFAVTGYGKTGESCHRTSAVAGYCVFAVRGYGKTEESCHNLGKLAGYDGFAVGANSTTGKSCHVPEAVPEKVGISKQLRRFRARPGCTF